MESTAQPTTGEDIADADGGVTEAGGADGARSLGKRLARTLTRVGILAGFAAVLLVGVCVLFYPSISEYLNAKNQSRVIEDFRVALGAMTPEDYSAQLAAARAYNERLASGGAAVRDAFTEGKSDVNREDEYWRLLNVEGNGMMGYVEVETLGIRLPVYHGTSDIVLSKGSGHIQGSSLPVGGASTHAVLTGHTGLPSAKLFTGIDRLRPGDTFTLHILNETLTYEVDQTATVLPHEVDGLAIEKGSDYATLVTCTPYGINSHRLFVRGTRTENPPEKASGQDAPPPDEAEAAADDGPGFFRKVYDGLIALLARGVEKAAEAIVAVTEWGMDALGVEY